MNFSSICICRNRSVALSSSLEWLVGFLGAVVEPLTGLLGIGIADFFHRSARKRRLAVVQALVW